MSRISESGRQTKISSNIIAFPAKAGTHGPADSRRNNGPRPAPGMRIYGISDRSWVDRALIDWRVAGDFGDKAVDDGKMAVPARRIAAAEAGQLRGAPGRARLGVFEHRRLPARAVERVDVIGDGAARFAQRRDVADQRRNAELQPLDQRKAEALG